MEQTTNLHDMTNKTVLDITAKHEVDDYPYGGLKTKMIFSIEFKKKKGFRSVKQSVNPKKNRLNKPHPSTYSEFVYMYRNEENGYIEFGNMRLSDGTDVNTMASFITQHFDALKLTQEMLKDLYERLHASVKRLKFQSSQEIEEAMANIIQPTLNTLTEGLKNGTNVFSQINLDIEAIKQLQKKHWSLL